MEPQEEKQKVGSLSQLHPESQSEYKIFNFFQVTDANEAAEETQLMETA